MAPLDVPFIWRRAITQDELKDILQPPSKSKAEQEQEEMAKLKAERERVELQAEIRNAKREVYMAEKDATIEELAQQFEEQGKSPQMARRMARMAVGEGSSGGGEGFDGLIKVLLVSKMMEAGSKPSPWGEAGGEFLKGLAGKAGQVMGDVIETAKDRLITPSAPPSGDMSLDDIKSAPENRRILWRKTADGWGLENLPAVAEGSPVHVVSPAQQVKDAMANWREIVGAVKDVAGEMGFTQQQPKEDNVKTYNIDFSSNGRTISIPFPMSSDGAGKIIDYLVRSEELTQKAKSEDERLAGLHGLVAWLAGMGTPADVYAQAKQRAEALTARYRKKDEAGTPNEPGNPIAQEPHPNPPSFETEYEATSESEEAFEPTSHSTYL